MAEFCKACGKPMENWDATHCSEECLLQSIKDAKPFPLDKEKPKRKTQS